MRHRRSMGLWDWINSAAFLAMGVFLGLAVNAMVQLVGTPFWPFIVIIPLLFGGVLLLDDLLDRLTGRILPGGVKPAPESHPKARRPLVLLLSLPMGLAIGLIGAQVGLGDILL